ncbi:uncharacterized protein LOC124657064 [Lolium rigidum]|uniref:uncharacterized protein LOC124657064 n=1 Tax=Lolium rigidum TaxID=89674 RepID=UPI001F5D0203|nr:uncharacterized protein LOC124657064 [Lolium rigidum]
MKRRELQALCKRHGLAAGGTNADLVARLTATLPGSGEAVGVVVGKGCLKRPAGGDSDAAKRVSFDVEEAEAGASGGARRGSLATGSPAVPRKRGRPKAGEAPPPAAARGNGGGRRLTRSQAGGDSADESDSGEADGPARRSDTRKNPPKAEQEEDAAGRRHQLKRKTRENDIEDVDGSLQAGVSRRSTRSGSLLVEPDALLSPVEKKRGRRKVADAKEKTSVAEQPTQALPSGRTLRSGAVVVAPVPPVVSDSKKGKREVQEEEPAVEKVAEVEMSPVVKKRGRRKAADAKEKTSVTEQPTEALPSGRTLRSGVVVVAPVPPIVPDSKKSKREVQEEEPVVEKVAQVEISRRTTRSGTVAAPLTSPKVIAKKRGRKADDVHSDSGLDKKTENKRQSSRLGSSIHHPASAEEEATLEQAAAPIKGLPPRITRGTMLSGAKDGVEKLDEHVGLKKSKLRKGSATVATSGGEVPFSDGSGKASATDMQIEVPGPVRRFTRKSVVPSSLEPETNGTHEDVEKKQTVTKPAGRSTRRSVAPVILEKESKGLTKKIVPEDVEKKQAVTKPVARSTRRSVAPVILVKESKGLTKEIVPEVHAKRPTRKSVVPAMLEKQPTVKQPVRRLTRKSAVPAMPEKDKKVVPDMLNNDKEDRTEMQSDTAGHLEKQLAVKEPVMKSASNSVVPDVIEKENEGLNEELKSEVSARTPACKSAVPNAVTKNNKDHNEFVRTEELSVKTRSAHTIQVALQNDESLQRTTRRSSKLVTSPPQSKPTASKGRPAKRRRTSSLQEDIPAEEQEEDQIAYGAHTKDVIEVKTTTDLEIGVLPSAAEKSDSRDPQLNTELASMIAEEPRAHKDDVIEVAASTDLGIGVLPFTDEKSDLQDPQLNSELEGLVVVEPGAHTDDVIEVATFTDLEIEVLPFAAEKSDLRESQLNSELEGIAAVEPGLSRDEDDTNVLESELEGTAGTSTDLEIGVLPFAAEKSVLRDSQLNSELVGMAAVEPGLSRDEDDTDVLESELEGTAGTTEKPPSNLPIPDSKHVGALSEEAVHSIESDAGRCSANFEQSPTGLQFLFSQGIAERSATHNAIPCPENSVEESDVHKVECQVETAVSSKSDSYNCSDENSVRAEESGGCTFSSQQNNEQEGFSVSSCPKDLVSSAQLDPPEDADHVVRDVFTKDLICKEEEKKHYIPSSDINVPHEISPANEPAENASGVSGDVFCISQSTRIFDEANSDSSRSESADALYNRIASSNTEAVQQDNKEEWNLHNGVTHGIHGSGMSEAAQVEASGSGKMLLPDVETSAFQDAQINHKQEGNESEEHSFSCSKDESGKNDMSQLANEYVLDSSQEKELELSHDLSAVKSPKVSTTCQDDELVIGSGIGQTSGCIVQGNNIAMNAPGTVEQGDDLNPSATALLSNRENTPASKIDAPEVSSDNLFVVDSSAPAVQSVSGRLREAGLAVDNPDNKICMEQVKQQVLEGTLENTALGSATPESNQQRGLFEEAELHSLTEERCSASVTPEGKHDCGLPDEVEPHSSKNERCSTGVEQSPFSLQHLFSQESIEEPYENVAVAVHAKNEVDKSKDIHVECGVGKSPVQEAVSDHDSSVDFGAVSKSEDCAHTSDEGLAMSCHEQEQMTCQLDSLEAANCMKEFTNPEEVPYDEENKKPVHSTYIISSCEPIHANEPVKHACSLGDGPLSSSPVASTDGTDVHPRSNPNQIESIDFLDEPKGSSTTDALQQGLKEQCDEPKENQVTLLSTSLLASTGDTDVHPSSNPNQFESTDLLDEPKGRSSTEALQQGLKEQSDELKEDDRIGAETAKDLESEVEKMDSSEPDSSKGSDMHGDLVLPSAENKYDAVTCHADPQVEKIVPSEHDSHQGSHEHSTLDEGIRGCKLSSQLEHEKDEQLILPLLAAETSALADEQANSKLEAGAFEKCNFSSEDTSQLEHEKDEQTLAPLLPAETSDLSDVQANPKLEAGKFEKCNFSSEGTSQLEHEKDEQTLAPLLAAETSVLSDVQANHELKAGEFEKSNFSREDTSGKIGIEFQLHKDSHMDPIQEKDLPNDLSAPKSSEQSTIIQNAKTLALLDEQPNPELEGTEFKELKSKEDSHVDPIEEKDHPNDLHAPKSPEQTTVIQDAKTLAMLDEQPNPELEAGEFEEHNLTSGDAGAIFGTAYVKADLLQLHEDYHPIQGKKLPDELPAPKSPVQSTVGQDAGTSTWLDGQPNPELEAGQFEECNFSSEDTSGQDAGTSTWFDRQPNRELEAGEFEECNFTSEDTGGIFGTGYDGSSLFELHEPIQGKELPSYPPAPESPKQSIIGQDEKTFGSDTSPLLYEELDLELEGEDYKDGKKEYNERNDDQATAAMLSTGMTKPTLTDGLESGMARVSAAGTPALTDEQLNSKLEDDKEQNLCFDTDTSNFSDAGLMENRNLFSLPEDVHTEACYERELPIGTPTAKSAGASAVCPYGSVPGSVGTCQTSISTKLQRFKISSAVKGSYITEQGENLRPISLHGNTENVPAANPDHPAELDTDWLDEDSSRQGGNDGL